MISWDCCRMCLSKQALNPISSVNEDKDYLEMVYNVTGVQILLKDQLPKQICTECTVIIEKNIKYREKCQETQKILNNELINRTSNFKIDNQCNNNDDNSNNHKIHIQELNENKTEHNNDIFTVDSVKNYCLLENQLCTDDSNSIQNHEVNFINITDYSKTSNNEKPKNIIKIKKSKVKLKAKEEEQKTPLKIKLKKIENIKEDSEVLINNEKGNDKKTIEEVKCEYCDKILTTKTSLRNHYKIHTGFDIICEHCGKKFITKRLLLMHCKAKHGYEKTDKCSFCDYRGCNSEQVKIHERKHTGERPYVCKECNASFFRKSSYLQHVATHLPEKTVPCKQCPARFKSVTLMKIHANKHRMTQFRSESQYKKSRASAAAAASASKRGFLGFDSDEEDRACTPVPQESRKWSKKRAAGSSSSRISATNNCNTEPGEEQRSKKKKKSDSRRSVKEVKTKKPAYSESFKCYVCHSSFARRRNVLRHLRRIHSVTEVTQDIERVSK